VEGRVVGDETPAGVATICSISAALLTRMSMPSNAWTAEVTIA
jgi:hypothetical protein